MPSSNKNKTRNLAIPQMDGTSDTRSQGRGASGSQAGGSQRGGTQRATQQSGPPGSSNAPVGYPTPLGFDPARDPNKSDDNLINKNLDLPPEAYMKQIETGKFAKRPAKGTSGKPVNIAVNQFRVMSVPGFDVYQYHVTIDPTPTKASFINMLWKTNTLQTALKSATKKAGRETPWLFDGRAIAWSRSKCPDITVMIDMDAEKGRPSDPKRDNRFNVLIKPTGHVRLASLLAYIKNQAGWDNAVLDAINFFDHLIRQYPSEHMLAIRRNFYNRATGQPNFPLGDSRIIAAFKGIYSSLRLNSSMATGGKGLGVNVDVANTVFFRAGLLREIMENWIRSLKPQWSRLREPLDFADGFKPVRGLSTNSYAQSEMFKELRKLAKLKFTTRHRGKIESDKVFTIKRFVFDDKLYGAAGANARTVRFKPKTADAEVTIEQYFLTKYNIRLQYPTWPVVETTRDGIFPVELLTIIPFQQYHTKLNGKETADMIKFAVTRPQDRAKAIMENVQTLRWGTDPYLKEFGLQINPQMQVCKARVLQNPEVEFRKKVNPGVSGRWDLRGQSFTLPNRRPLKSWGLVIVDNCCDKPTAARFAETFARTYKSHGGNLVLPDLRQRIYNLKYQDHMGDELAAIVTDARNGQPAPDLLFFILGDKTSFKYERLKRNMDIRFACLTQMVQSSHVVKAQAQYCSNVAMKVNAKLGGQTSRIPSAPGVSSGGFFLQPTMCIGVDVSHASPGSTQASMAAMSVSMDKDTARYAGACETNGDRVEILAPPTLQAMLGPLVVRWKNENKGLAPVHVFYFRDGVSEGQFAHVLDVEIEDGVRGVFKRLGLPRPQITVIVATKRHHIRFFPQQGQGDRNGNPLPGTVLEEEVTHPFQYDFYLCSHVAIQGTARPTHYSVIHDEIKFPVDKLQSMIYHHCYQYARSSTPVSLHPAIYYAHLISNRARAHEDANASERDPAARQAQRQMPLAKFDNLDERESQRRGELASLPLLKPGGSEGLADPKSVEFFKGTMWYI